MKKEEKELFKALCKFREKDFDKNLLKHATPTVLGHLFFNRMSAIAYGVLKESKNLGALNREFRNSIKIAYEKNTEKNHSYLKCVAYLSELLMRCNCPVAMLKGAVLCGVYPEGYRTSNDIDLLVMPSDVSLIGDMLLSNGFRQGNIRNSEFVPADRKEIIESKMLRGETVPYIKEVDLPSMKYLEVDINFSLDYKNSDTTALIAMLERTTYKNVNGIRIPTLAKDDFFIHLCGHLYKEATTLPWIEMKRDMTLYKYADIYMLLSDMSKSEMLDLYERAKELDMDKICAFAILQTIELFSMNNLSALNLSRKALKTDSSFPFRIISPKERKSYIYRTKNTTKRFFMENRAKDLEETSQ